MPDDQTDSSVWADGRVPRYTTIELHLRQAITDARLPPGTVVTEDPVARLFGTSRTPVRTALIELERQGLLCRFEGRGYVVAGSETPQRITLTGDMLHLSPASTPAPPPMTAERLARDFECSVAQALPYGLFRVHEQAAADHFGVSRTVVRELLSRFQDRGLVRKDLRSHWVVGPLTARDVAHYFAIRAQLEPLALRDSAPRMDAAEIHRLLLNAQSALHRANALPPADLEQIETDLHVTLLSHSPNRPLLRMIHQSQIALAVNQVFAETVGTCPFAVALTEHCMVLEFLIRGSWEAAAEALREHLRLSAERTRKRLMSISVFPEPVLPDYLRPISQ